jgi:hypothetical protein
LANGLATVAEVKATRQIEIVGPPEAHILWRWMGIRATPHLPCRFDGNNTIELAKKFIDIGRGTE